MLSARRKQRLLSLPRKNSRKQANLLVSLLFYDTSNIDFLVGVAAKEPIGPLEAFLFVPQTLIICEEQIKASAIGHIVKQHPALFVEHYDQEYLVLIVFVMSEMCKGELSFWHPYFETVSESDLPFEWSPEEVGEVHDELLRVESREYAREVLEQWEAVRGVIRLYPKEFPPEKCTKQLFERCYKLVVSRCFGWQLPGTMLVPLADCLNHFNSDTQYEMFSSRLHFRSQEQANEAEKKYYTHAKQKVDYSFFFPEGERKGKAPISQSHKVKTN